MFGILSYPLVTFLRTSSLLSIVFANGITVQQCPRQQDNLYLSKYARAFGVMGAKASETDELAWLLNKSAALSQH